jgi:hypothetical protein
MKRIVSYDLDYVRGETCMTKWTEEDGPMPGYLVRCGKPAVAGVGLTRDGAAVHPADPRAAGDTFCYEEHVVALNALESGEYKMERMPTAKGGEN